MSSVFSIELDGISKACSAKVMMNRPVTIMMAIEAMNSDVVSFGFAGFCVSAVFRAFCGAVFTEFLVVAKCVVPRCCLACKATTAPCAECGANAGFRPGWLGCAPDSKVYQMAAHRRGRQRSGPLTSKRSEEHT